MAALHVAPVLGCASSRLRETPGHGLSAPLGAPVVVALRLTDDESVVVDELVMARIGEPHALERSSGPDETIALLFLVSHWAARADGFSVRLELRRRGAIIAAPILLVKRGELANIEAAVDDRRLRLQVGVALPDGAESLRGPVAEDPH
jgi:hypothetical protein